MTAGFVPLLAAAQRIPFKAEPAGVGSALIAPLLITVLLLALAVAALWVARQKGWLRRWTSAPMPGAARPEGLRVEQVLRLSPRTRLYRVRDGARVFDVLECGTTAQVVEVPHAH